MAYNKTAWSAGRVGNTAVNVARLDNMEDGIAAAVRAWQPGEVLTAGEVRVAPDGHVITRNANGTARGSYDATEQGNWTVIGGGGSSGQPLQQIAAPVSANGTLAANKHTPVDATTAARTMTLPTGQAEGTQISAEKIDSSSNTVTVSGNIRGGAGISINLAWQFETLLLRADSSGSWWPIAGHKTKAALDAAYGARLTTFEMVPFTGFGHSYVAGQNVDTGTTAFDRFAKRQLTQTLVNRGAAGLKMVGVLGRVQSNWVAGTRGLVGLLAVINDVTNYGDTLGANTTVEAFRSICALLSAMKIGTSSDAGLLYSGTGWTAGVSSTASSYVDLGWNGDSVHLLLNFEAGTGASLTVTRPGGTTVTTISTGGYKETFAGAVKLSGFGTGDHTVRVTLNSGTTTIVGYAVPSATPPLIAWLKEGPVTLAGYPTGKNALLANTYHPAVAAVAAGFSNVVPIDPTGWDMNAMLGPDLLHPNDAGTLYWANRMEAALTGRQQAQGLNRLSSSDTGTAAYVTPTPNFGGGSPVAPGAPTSVTAVAGNAQATVTFTPPASNGGATITSYTVTSSPGSLTGTGASSPITVTGLTNGTAYTFTVTATNSAGTGTASSASNSVTPSVGGSTFAADDFNRADGAPGSTPTGGLAWTTTASATFAIVSNVLKCTARTADPGDCYVDDGQSDGTISLRLVSASSLSGLIFRASGTNNANGYAFWNNAGTYTLSKRTSVGTYSPLSTVAGVTAAAGDLLTVVLSGTSIVCKVNGTTGITTTDATYTGTRHGAWAHGTNMTFDDFSHTT